MAKKKSSGGCGCLIFVLLALGGGWYWYSDGNIPGLSSGDNETASNTTPISAEEEQEDSKKTEAAPEAVPAPTTATDQVLSVTQPQVTDGQTGVLAELAAIRQLIEWLDKTEAAAVLAAKNISPAQYTDALYDATRASDADLAIRLLACGASATESGSNYDTTAELIYYKEDLSADIIKVIASVTMEDVNKPDKDGDNLLYKTIRNKNSTIKELLRAKGAVYGNKLQTAVIYGDIEAATAALNEGISINDGGKDNASPLFLSLGLKDTKMLEFLLSKGADTKLLVGPKNWSLARAAVELANPEALKILINAKIDVNQSSSSKPNRTALHVACQLQNNQPCAILLLEAGADVNKADANGNLALHTLMHNIYNSQSVDIAQTMIAKGVDIHKTNKTGYTPMLSLASCMHEAYAADSKRDKQATIGMLNELLKAGADPHIAHAAKNTSADVDLRGYDGPVTALRYAELCNATECIDILKTACENTKPSPASMLSSAISMKDAVNMLEEHGLLKTHMLQVTNPFFSETAYQEITDLECVMTAAIIGCPPPCYYKRRVSEFSRHCKLLNDNLENINDYAYLSSVYILSKWVTTYSMTDPSEKILEEVTKAFLAAGHDINKVSSAKGDDSNLLISKDTPLITAARCGYAGVVKLLLQLGADPNLKNGSGETARSVATQEKKTEVLNVLNELAPAPQAEPAPAPQAEPAPAPAAEETGDTAATPEKKVATAEALKKLKPLYNRLKALKCKEKSSALCQKRLLALLDNIRAGGDINAPLPETEGSNALHNSCSLGSLSITRWLLENGADPNIKTANGEAPIAIVDEDNRDAIIALLKKHGATSEDSANETTAEPTETSAETESSADAEDTTENLADTDSAPETQTEEVEAEPEPIFAEDGTPTEETVNNVVTKRFSLLTTRDVTLDEFKTVFADEVIELKAKKEVNVSTMHEKAIEQDKKWPSRAIKLLNMGVSGLKIEVNVALVYKNSETKKSISAYNKIVMLLDDEGKICGMSESISTKKPSLSKGYKSVKFTGDDPVFAIAD